MCLLFAMRYGSCVPAVCVCSVFMRLFYNFQWYLLFKIFGSENTDNEKWLGTFVLLLGFRPFSTNFRSEYIFAVDRSLNKIDPIDGQMRINNL